MVPRSNAYYAVNRPYPERRYHKIELPRLGLAQDPGKRFESERVSPMRLQSNAQMNIRIESKRVPISHDSVLRPITPPKSYLDEHTNREIREIVDLNNRNATYLKLRHQDYYMPYAHQNFRQYRNVSDSLLTRDLDIDLEPMFIPRRNEATSTARLQGHPHL